MKIRTPLLLCVTLLALLCSSAASFGQDDKLIQPKKMVKDFEQLEEMITAHPDPYTHTPEAIFNEKIDSVKSTLSEPLSTLEFFKKTAFIVALIRDGHSSAMLPNSWVEDHKKDEGCFPYEMHLTNKNELYVLKNFSEGEMKPGTKVLSINGITTDSFLRSIDPYISYELESFRNTIIDDNFEQYLYLAFGKIDGLTFEYQSSSISKSVIKNIPKKEWEKFQKDGREERDLLIAKGNPYAYENLGNGVGQIHIYGFSTDNFKAYNLFLLKTFKKIQKDSIHSLIIDIRGNYGGWPKIASELFHYIHEGYFKTMAKSSAKVSYPYQRFYYDRYPYLRTSPPSNIDRRHYVDLYSILTKDLGTYLNESASFNEEPITEKSEFNGDVYLLTNRDSYSAASSFASTFQCYSMGIIIGEETGGTKIFRANPIFIYLNSSEITVRMSTTKLYTACYNDEFQGVTPNIEYSPSIYELISGADTQLLYAQRIIKKALKKRREQSEASPSSN